LANRRRLLVPGNASDPDGRAKNVWRRHAEIASAIAHVRQHGTRHPEDPQQIVIPLAGMDIVEQRARGIGGVGGMGLASGQAPQKETVDGPEQQLAGLRLGAGTRYHIEDPADLGSGEVRIEQQTRLARDNGLVAVGLELLANV
jgi:hypothetical protein